MKLRLLIFARDANSSKFKGSLRCLIAQSIAKDDESVRSVLMTGISMYCD